MRLRVFGELRGRLAPYPGSDACAWRPVQRLERRRLQWRHEHLYRDAKHGNFDDGELQRALQEMRWKSEVSGRAVSTLSTQILGG